MADDPLDAAYGWMLVAGGVLIGWVAATWGSPIVGVLGATYAVVGVATLFLEVYMPDEPDVEALSIVGADADVSLSDAPEFVREDLPPSSKLVWMYLAARGESTLDDIVDGTQLTPRTARNAITRLEKYEAVSKRPTGQGTRQLSYDVRTPEPEVAADPEDDRRTPAKA